MAERFVWRYDRDILAQRLRYDLPIEGIAVVNRQGKQAEDVIGSERQDADVQIVERLPRDCG
jgi:hypothetical protein